MLKKLFILLVIIIIPSCGYTPIYKDNINQNIGISILSIEGSDILNKKLDIELNKYINKNTENKNTENKNTENLFKIKVMTNFEKETISKDSKGNATNFELSASVKFTIVFENEEKMFVFEENLKIQNKEDSFEQQKYENIVITNFAKSFGQKLILELNNL